MALVSAEYCALVLRHRLMKFLLSLHCLNQLQCLSRLSFLLLHDNKSQCCSGICLDTLFKVLLDFLKAVELNNNIDVKQSVCLKVLDLMCD